MQSIDIGRVDRTYDVDGSTFRVSILDENHPDRESCENAAVASGIPLAVQHRASWRTVNTGSKGSWFVHVVGPNGKPDCAFAASLLKSRALPSHYVLRVERFGTGAGLSGRIAGLAALLDLARTSSRLFRIHLELFSPDSAARTLMGDAARELGFRPRTRSRLYRRTVGVDLEGTYDDVFRRLRSCARRNIKLALKSPVVVTTLSDRSLEPRINELFSETFARNGGPVDGPDWNRLMRFCSDNPGLGRFVGLQRTDVRGPAGLVAFSVGRFHGDHAELTYSASTRLTDLKVPMAYPLMWDLLKWSKDLGADWFDVGGITDPGDGSSHDSLGGISAFKKHFSVDVIDVADEWVLDLRPVRSAVARAVSGVAGWLRLTAPVVAASVLGDIQAIGLLCTL